MTTSSVRTNGSLAPLGYLPNDRPPAGRLVLLGLQHVVTMFPATVLVALLCGFHVDTVLFGAGVSTVVALLLSRRRIGTSRRANCSPRC